VSFCPGSILLRLQFHHLSCTNMVKIAAIRHVFETENSPKCQMYASAPGRKCPANPAGETPSQLGRETPLPFVFLRLGLQFISSFVVKLRLKSFF